MRITTENLTTGQPYDAGLLLAFLGAHAVPGVESWDGVTYARSLRLPHGAGTMHARASRRGVEVEFALLDARDRAAALRAARSLLALGAPSTGPVLASDPLLGPLVAARPGVRVPGDVDPHETAVRAVLGQQVSRAGARTVAGRIVAAHGDPLPAGLAEPGLRRTFPSAATLAAADPAGYPLPRARIRALTGLAAALASGALVLERRTDGDDAARAAVRRDLVSLPGIGPWTAGVIALRSLGDPDAWLPTDLGVRRGLEALGAAGDPVSAAAIAERWRPQRSLALMHLWYVVVLGRALGSAGAQVPREPAIEQRKIAKRR